MQIEIFLELWPVGPAAFALRKNVKWELAFFLSAARYAGAPEGS
jgi:hypothetical protein